MKSMQEENSNKKVLTNEMATFIVINTASIQIIPTTVIAIRNSFCAAIAGITATKIFIKMGK